MKKTYENQNEWKKIMEKLPKEYHFNSKYKPTEEYWNYENHVIHLDTFRNPDAPAKIIAFHGVGTNGRQISMILGGPQFNNGYETIMIDMPTYGITEVNNRSTVTYDDWVKIGAALIEKELLNDKRPIFLYGLSAGGMETYHVASKNPKIKGIIGMTFLNQKNQLVRDKTTNNIIMSRLGVPMLKLLKKIGLGKVKMPMWLASKMSALVNDKETLKLFLKDKTSAGNWVSVNFLQSYMNYEMTIKPENFDIAPILLTQPSEDKWTPYELSKPVLDFIKKVPVIIKGLPNGSHYPIEKEALKVMNEEIDLFIKNNL